MATETKRFCDRCKREKVDKYEAWFGFLSWEIFPTFAGVTNLLRGTVDLCPDCFKAAEAFLNIKAAPLADHSAAIKWNRDRVQPVGEKD